MPAVIIERSIKGRKIRARRDGMYVMIAGLERRTWMVKLRSAAEARAFEASLAGEPDQLAADAMHFVRMMLERASAAQWVAQRRVGRVPRMAPASLPHRAEEFS